MPRRSALVAPSLLAVVLAVGLASCGRQNAVLPPGGPIASDDLCAELVEAGCDWGVRCGMAPTDRPTCRQQLTNIFDACPFMVEAIDRGETTYDAVAAASYIEAFRSNACGAAQPDPIAMGVFTPLVAEGLACHSKVSCKTGLECEGLTISTPAGTCRAP